MHALVRRQTWRSVVVSCMFVLLGRGYGGGGGGYGGGYGGYEDRKFF